MVWVDRGAAVWKLTDDTRDDLHLQKKCEASSYYWSIIPGPDDLRLQNMISIIISIRLDLLPRSRQARTPFAVQSCAQSGRGLSQNKKKTRVGGSQVKVVFGFDKLCLTCLCLASSNSLRRSSRSASKYLRSASSRRADRSSSRSRSKDWNDQI